MDIVTIVATPLHFTQLYQESSYLIENLVLQRSYSSIRNFQMPFCSVETVWKKRYFHSCYSRYTAVFIVRKSNTHKHPVYDCQSKYKGKKYLYIYIQKGFVILSVSPSKIYFSSLSKHLFCLIFLTALLVCT